MTDSAQPHLPLSGVVVLDLTLARAGPTAVRHLADWGADVIRVEAPSAGGEDVVGRRSGSDFQNLHRNKRAIQLNLKSEEGYKIFMKLVEKADVLVENMRAPVKGRLKIAYDDLKKVNPRLVYGSISGFGQTGPYSQRGGLDQIAQGMGGLQSVTGEPGRGPMRVGIPISDLCSGSFLAMAISMALFDRTRTGEGRWVHTSLLESMIFLMDFQASRYLVKGEVPGQTGNDHPISTPMGVFPTRDGHINIAASSGRLWERFCDAVERPQWKTDAKWRTAVGRQQDRPALNAAICEITKGNSSAYWTETFEAAGIPAGPIYTMDKVFADPQVQHIGMAAPLNTKLFGETKFVASPVNFEGIPRKLRSETPEVGQHTAEVLDWIGVSKDEQAHLKAAGVI